MTHRPRMWSEIAVELTVCGFTCSHDDITKALGVAPDHTWFKGDPVGRKKKYHHRYKNTGWLLDAGLPANAAAQDQVRALLGRLRLDSAARLAACRPYEAFVTCVVYSY